MKKDLSVYNRCFALQFIGKSFRVGFQPLFNLKQLAALRARRGGKDSAGDARDGQVLCLNPGRPLFVVWDIYEFPLKYSKRPSGVSSASEASCDASANSLMFTPLTGMNSTA